MTECEICYEEKTDKEKIILPCSHSLCNSCYDRIKFTCPFCRQPINDKIESEEQSEILDDEPDYWLEYDNREWITYSRFLRNGTEIIRTFRKSSIPDGWRNDDLTTIIKRRKQRRRRTNTY